MDTGTTARPAPAPATQAGPAAVRHLKPTRQLVEEALRDLPTPLEPPAWSHRLLPPPVRNLMAGLGWWQNPIPQPPSIHLEQTLTVLEKYGWCQRLDVSITGQLCIRGAQHVLQKTGHATPHSRERAVHYMQQVLTQSGITLPFYDWNDLPDLEFSAVQALLKKAAHNAQKNGE